MGMDDAVIIGIGSSLAGDFGTRQALLEAAVGAFPNVGMLVQQLSRWWKSAAWPDPSLPYYLNGVAVVETALEPPECLAALLDLERRFGRVRGEPNAPRTLDLDLVAFGRRVIDEPGLTVPHPQATRRRFVLGPLAEIAPGWRDPVSGRTARQLAPFAHVGADAQPV